MRRNVDLLRNLLLELEDLQRSPAEAFFLPLEDIARRLRQEKANIVEGLALLRNLDFIDAPGEFGAGWIFRQLTPRGCALLAAVEDENNWLEIRKAYHDFDAG